MFKFWKIIVIFLIAIVIFSGATLTSQHNNKLGFFLNNVEPIEVSDLIFLYSTVSDDPLQIYTKNQNDVLKLNHYSLSFKATQNIKNMTITALAIDKNNNQMRLVDPNQIKIFPPSIILSSNETLSKSKTRTVEIIYVSINNQNLGSLQFYIYDESNRLNNLISTYNVPVTINKNSR
jgi:hypothetical protein